MTGRAPPPDTAPDAGYSGPATLVVGGSLLDVRVELRGHFEPIDGYYHWYGRVAAHAELDRLVSGNRAEVVLRTPAGERAGELSDPDLWGRYRIAGQSTPPFASGLEAST